ncbi:MAG: VOC family protein [Mucilaginibacter polytrichastri]|nr:VOC family protein [Mucilaginibacter polytrichastri]
MNTFFKAALGIAFIFFSTVNASAQMKKASPVFNHAALYVKDLKTTTDFYRNMLGLEQTDEPFKDGKHSWFSLGSGKLHLIADETAAPESVNKNTHLCLSVPSLPDVIERLKKNGVKYGDWGGKPGQITTRVDGVLQIFLQDPDGHWLEINNEK